MVEIITRENLNLVDQWRAIERLVALGWTEEAIGVALALPVRQIRKLRLLVNVLPAMLDHMAKGDMPNENQLRTIVPPYWRSKKKSGRRISRPRRIRRFPGGTSQMDFPKPACMRGTPALVTNLRGSMAS